MKNRLILRQLKGLSHSEIKFLPQNKLSTLFRPGLCCVRTQRAILFSRRAHNTRRESEKSAISQHQAAAMFLFYCRPFFISQPSGGIIWSAQVTRWSSSVCIRLHGERTYSMYVGSTHCRWTRWCGFTVVRLFVLCTTGRCCRAIITAEFESAAAAAAAQTGRSFQQRQLAVEVRFMTQSIYSARPCPAPLLQICWRCCSLAW